MEYESLEGEILDLENQYWTAIKNSNVEDMLRLTDESCIVAGASGVMKMSREDLSKMMSSPQSYELLDFKLHDHKVSVFNNDTAVIAYKVHEDLTVDGKPVHMEASDSSTWVRREGKWTCLLHTESILGDPFGRDRQALDKETATSDETERH